MSKEKSFEKLLEEQVDLFDANHDLIYQNVKNWHREQHGSECQDAKECEDIFMQEFALIFRDAIIERREKRIAELRKPHLN